MKSGKGSLPSNARLKIPSVPLEWMDTRAWRLPSGKALAEFALQAGFLAPLLLKTERIPPVRPKPKSGEPASDHVSVEGCR
jgi:hypothetical protein